MACFQKRSGAWRAIVKRKGYGVQTRTFDSKADAEVWARRIEEEMDRGVFVSRIEAESTTRAEALDRYTIEISSHKRSADRERSTITAWRESSLSRRMLASIRGKDIAQSVRRMEGRDLSPNTIRIHLALLSHLFNGVRAAWGMESLTNPVPETP